MVKDGTMNQVTTIWADINLESERISPFSSAGRATDL